MEGWNDGGRKRGREENGITEGQKKRQRRVSQMCVSGGVIATLSPKKMRVIDEFDERRRSPLLASVRANVFPVNGITPSWRMAYS